MSPGGRRWARPNDARCQRSPEQEFRQHGLDLFGRVLGMASANPGAGQRANLRAHHFGEPQAGCRGHVPERFELPPLGSTGGVMGRLIVKLDVPA